jgi:hypothetical protein
MIAYSKTVKPEFRPKIKPIKTAVGGKIKVLLATGIPLPVVGHRGGFRDEMIRKRALRVVIQKRKGISHSFIGNVVQIPAIYDPECTDIWKFEKKVRDTMMNHILVRAIKGALNEEEDLDDLFLVFEFVIYVQLESDDEDLKEICCAWTELPLRDMKRSETRTLPLKGGSPLNPVDISSREFRTERTGLNSLKKAMFGVEKMLEIKIEPLEKIYR